MRPRQAKLYGTKEQTEPVKCCETCEQVLPRKLSTQVNCSADVYAHMRALDYCTAQQESFVVFSLDTRNKVVDRTVVALGSVNTVHVHPSEVVRPAILRSCSSVVVAHNHPSGDPSPSPEDRKLTERISKACTIMGVKMLDHVIVSDAGYYSFCDGGAL